MSDGTGTVPQVKRLRALHMMDLLLPMRAGVGGVQAGQHPKMGDHWYWCRVHQRGEHVDWTMVGCSRIGPFMTVAEAEQCTGIGEDW